MTTGMECSCVCDFDYDPPELYKQKDRRARKTHKCYECKSVISPGEMYVYTVGV